MSSCGILKLPPQGRTGGYQPPPETQTFESFDLGSGAQCMGQASLSGQAFPFREFFGSLCLAGGFKHLLFSPLFGEDFDFLTHIFQMG